MLSADGVTLFSYQLITFVFRVVVVLEFSRGVELKV
jgi:hypothetical protein